MQILCCVPAWEDFDELDPKELNLFQQMLSLVSSVSHIFFHSV